jgi:hypothetical protein
MQHGYDFVSSQKPMDLSRMHVSPAALMGEKAQSTFSIKEASFALGSIPFPEEKLMMAKKMLEGVSSSLDEEIIGEDFF